MNTRPYYQLLVKWKRGANWSPEFGDYSREVVYQEIEDTYKECYNTKIVNTNK